MRGSGMPTISERRAGHPCGKKILHVSCRMALMGANLFRMLPFAGRFASRDGRGERISTMVRAARAQCRLLRQFYALPHVRAARLRLHPACFVRGQGPTFGTSALLIASGSSSGVAAPWLPKMPEFQEFRHDGELRHIGFPTDIALHARQGWRTFKSGKFDGHHESFIFDTPLEWVGNGGRKLLAARADAEHAWAEESVLDARSRIKLMSLATVAPGKICAQGAVAESQILGVRRNA